MKKLFTFLFSISLACSVSNAYASSISQDGSQVCITGKLRIVSSVYAIFVGHNIYKFMGRKFDNDKSLWPFLRKADGGIRAKVCGTIWTTPPPYKHDGYTSYTLTADTIKFLKAPAKQRTCSTSTPFKMKFSHHSLYNTIRIIALTRKLTVRSMQINDGNCKAEKYRLLGFYQCDRAGGWCARRAPTFPFTLKYGGSRSVTISCTPYKVVVTANDCDYTMQRK